MASRYGRGYRRTKGYKRRYSRRKYSYRSRRTRRFSRRRSVSKSAVVCLTKEYSWNFRRTDSQTGEHLYSPITFAPPEMPGFKDYQAVYSHFRILKAKAYIATQYVDQKGLGQMNYMVVGSRPFAATTKPLTEYPVPEYYFVPDQPEEVLRQARFQKLLYPNTTRQNITAGFYPYTMVGTMGPTQFRGDSFIFQRIWEAKRWMPFTWAWEPQTGADQSVRFFGPYIVRNIANSDTLSPPLAVNVQLKVWYQFKGQK